MANSVDPDQAPPNALIVYYHILWIPFLDVL